MQAEQDANAMSYNKANAVSRTVSKSSRLYKNSSWDLVDAEKETNFSYDEIKDSELPQELKGKSTSEIKTYVEEKAKTRKRLQDEIATLNLSRRNYIDKQTKDSSNGLENALIKALKSQAEQKNYKWE
ncbi:hypothetical protein ADIWIN_3294 [Winogradskyella psychrotolerans RS-3]|uniref:Uncharacterized protein n=1 Tax=Winogradskyella psychrotolerans RS-3 TaxID=641526 RepID=S7WWX5_9FLAO|nr:hypothetical protein [Winogradskyella psychrotolerans]EPR71249.1 hypothetical protein ADIWIN_3294 [Winogradskyella psychrotolerans RS-3]